MLKTFNLWEGELEYIEQLLKEDVRNNSAWNQVLQSYLVNSPSFLYNENMITEDILNNKN